MIESTRGSACRVSSSGAAAPSSRMMMLLGSGHGVGMVTSLGFLEQVLVSAKKPMEQVKFQICLGGKE